MAASIFTFVDCNDASSIIKFYGALCNAENRDPHNPLKYHCGENMLIQRTSKCILRPEFMLKEYFSELIR